VAAPAGIRPTCRAPKESQQLPAQRKVEWLAPFGLRDMENPVPDVEVLSSQRPDVVTAEAAEQRQQTHVAATASGFEPTTRPGQQVGERSSAGTL
jgi:hypothetical protein